jgi:hypothetical protein
VRSPEYSIENIILCSETFAVYTGVPKGAVHRWLLLWAVHVVCMRKTGDSVRNLGEKYLGKWQPRIHGNRGDMQRNFRTGCARKWFVSLPLDFVLTVLNLRVLTPQSYLQLY